MPGIVVGGFLVVHGLITTFIGLGAVTAPNAPAMAVPTWLNWWPGPFGRSWLVDALNLGTMGSVGGGLLWLGAGVMVVAAGAGFLGFAPVRDLWPLLAVAGGAVALVALAVYFHPIYLAAVAINLALLVLAWGRLNAAA